MLIALVVVGATVGRLIRLPGAGLLGPMALTVALELTGLSFGLTVPMVLVQVGYMLIGWQAGVAFTRESLRAIGRMLPAAIGLIVVLDRRDRRPRRAAGPLHRAHARWRATSPPAPAASTRCWRPPSRPGPTSRSSSPPRWCGYLLMLFAAPLLARAVVRVSERFSRQSRAITAASREPIRVAD